MEVPEQGRGRPCPYLYPPCSVWILQAWGNHGDLRWNGQAARRGLCGKLARSTRGEMGGPDTSARPLSYKELTFLVPVSLPPMFTEPAHF